MKVLLISAVFVSLLITVVEAIGDIILTEVEDTYITDASLLGDNCNINRGDNESSLAEETDVSFISDNMSNENDITYNLFSYATSELSHSALWAWILRCADSNDEKYKLPRRIALSFFKEFMTRISKSAEISR